MNITTKIACGIVLSSSIFHCAPALADIIPPFIMAAGKKEEAKPKDKTKFSFFPWMAAQKNADEDHSYSSRIQGKVYGGYALAYGRMSSGGSSIASSLGNVVGSALDLFSVETKEGGYAYRIFVGGLCDVGPVVSIGAEVGYSNYPKTETIVTSDFIIPITATTVSYGYGYDILMNVSAFIIPQYFISVKPGVQLAHQKNVSDTDLSSIFSLIEGLISGLIPGVNIGLGDGQFIDSYSTTSILPMVIISTGWNFMDARIWKWKLRRHPIVVEAFYQHVWGQDSNPATSLVSSRDMVGATIGIRF